MANLARAVVLALLVSGPLLADPPQPPIFTGCPDEVSGYHCDSLLYSVVAIDPNMDQPGYSRNVRYHLVSGPGEVDFKTGLWVWHPDPDDVHQWFEVEIAASAHDTMTTGDENCRFMAHVVNRAPEIGEERYQYRHIEIGETARAIFPAVDPDWCDEIVFVIDTVRGDPIGPYALDSATGELLFTPTPDDNNKRFEFYVRFTDGIDSRPGYVMVEVGEVPPVDDYVVSIDKTDIAFRGMPLAIDVSLNKYDEGIAYSSFFLVFDSQALHLNDVVMGDFPVSCDWEIIDWQEYPVGYLLPDDPNLIGVRVTLASDDRRIPGQPSCYEPDTVPAALFTLECTVTEDTTYQGDTIPVSFFWPSCSYNSIQTTEYNRVVTDRVIDLHGDTLPRPDSLPSFAGVPIECSPSPHHRRAITIEQGYVHIVGPGDISDFAGDCNRNGIPWEPADFALFRSYFYGGCQAYYCGCSDPNADGINDHISDYVLVLLVSFGAVDPPDQELPTMSSQTVTIINDTLENTVMIGNTDSIGALYLVFDGEVTIQANQPYAWLHSWFDGEKTHVVEAPTTMWPHGSVVFGDLNDGLLLTYTGDGYIEKAEASTREGIRIPAGLTVRPSPFQVVIESEAGDDGEGVPPSNFHKVDVSLVYAPMPIGGFSMLFAYDASSLSFAGAFTDRSPLYQECGWEYFTYRTGANAQCDSACPSGLATVVGIAETNNGPVHPDICNVAEMDPPTLFSMEFLVSAQSWNWLPIDFYWVDCNDNVLSNRLGDTLFVSKRVIQRTHYQSPYGPEAFPWTDVTNDTVGFPTYGGAQQPCTATVPNSHFPVSAIEFVGGGFYVGPPDSIDLGDINLDGIAYTIADIRMFADYLIYGDTVFQSLPGDTPIETASTASDINQDGEELTIEDLVLLCRVVTGDATYPPPTDPVPEIVHFDRTAPGPIIYQGPYDLGAVRVVLEGNCQVNYAENQFAAVSHTDGDSTVVMVYTYNIDHSLDAGPIVHLLPPGCGAIRRVTAATYDGRKVICEVGMPTDVNDDDDNLPTHFALGQNYPNPFNPSTTIEFALPEAADVRITVYNVTGREVTTLVESSMPAGYHQVVWDGRDESGRGVASGVYLYRIEAGGFSDSRKMLLLK
ncbi:T9SS type A sorting domain-containing protein [candidate division GN15 bacterium]|nr:T9SS type A sorting domain-containing protein [candidate division GN15 bacterium]